MPREAGSLKILRLLDPLTRSLTETLGTPAFSDSKNAAGRAMSRDWQHERGMNQKGDGAEQAAVEEPGLSLLHCP